jgi:hypothetical protein
MTWKLRILDGLSGPVKNYIMEFDDGSMRISLESDPDVIAWLAEGNTPEPWEAPNAD